ncbi:MAG: hemin uptake protein HemP [Lysobacter sp.]|nr:hemin uptake protein HemP [Lysobacter sp.]
MRAQSDSGFSAAAVAAQHVFDSAGLLKGTREIVIQHGDVSYRLRHTRNGKLILTK